MTDCTESYRDCVESRSEQIDKGLYDNPQISSRKLADLLGVSEKAVRNHRKKKEDASSTAGTVEPDKLERSAEFETRPLIRELIRLIDGCSALERRYLREVILRIYL